MQHITAALMIHVAASADGLEDLLAAGDSP